MLTNSKKLSPFGMNRRIIIGGLLMAGGGILSSCKMPSTGEKLKNKGKVILDGVPQSPSGLKEAVQFPLIESIHGRRSRRFSLGANIPDGPLKFSSKHDPLPLTELEQMMILTTVAGNTGWLDLIPYNKNYLPHIPNYTSSAGGRTFPSAAGFHTTEFFYTDDNGTYFLATRDAPSLTERDIQGRIDLNDYLKAHKSRIQKLSDKRLNIPQSPEHMKMHNTWCANVPGSTLIIPVADAAQHHIASLMYLVQNGACIYDDINKTPIPGIEKFSSIVDIENPYPMTFVDQLTLSEVTVEISTSCYAGMLMQQAMGLGGWMFDGINPFSVLGASGNPEVPGLGFRFDVDERWPLPNVTGLPGVFEGYCPPHYKDMRTAVEVLSERKFGPGGPYNPNTPGPYKNNTGVRKSGEVHNEEFKECVTTMAQYIYDTFGKFPATVPSIFAMMYLQTHHLDIDFHNEHFTEGSYLETHAEHMKSWHSNT